ncbi:MAG: DUF3568 family protein [Candidatus Omnitrophota bacterium]
MRTPGQNVFAGIVLLSAAVLSSGCVPLVVGAAAGTGTYIWVKGNLEREMSVSVAELYRAARSALHDLGYSVEQDEEAHDEARLTGRTPAGTRVKIVMQGLTEHTSRVVIRYGIWGSEYMSQVILNAVIKNL